MLKEKITDPGVREVVIKDCVNVVDGEVAAKKGITGMMIKGGYKAFKAIKPGIVEEAVRRLLDDFCDVLDKEYESFCQDESKGNQSFEQWASRRDAQIADDLLGITDDIMNRTVRTVLQKIYRGLRGLAQKNVAAAVPAIARLVMKHAEPSEPHIPAFEGRG